MRRVLVIGSSGSGKSTLARALGQRLGLPVVHLDRHFWRAGWVEPSPETWAAQVGRLLEADAWVMDGNHRTRMAARLARADAVVFLDLPRALCLLGVVRRRLQFAGRTRPSMAPGCRERVSWDFLRYVWSYPTARRPDVLRLLGAADGVRVVRLRSRREVRAFLDGLPPHP